MQQQPDDIRELLRLVGIIREKEYQRGWHDAVEAMRSAADNLQKVAPATQVPTDQKDGAGIADSEKAEGPQAPEALRTITGGAAPDRSEPRLGALAATPGRQPSAS
jgi:hypothetical protein